MVSQVTDFTSLNQEFHSQGYTHVKSFISSLECDRLIYRMRELVYNKSSVDRVHTFDAGEEHHTNDDFFINSARKISFFFDPKASGKIENPFNALNKVGHALHDLCPVFSKFSKQARFYHLLKALGQRSPQLVQSMFIFKQAKFGDEVPAHQDASFLYTEPVSVIGLWFALEDADEENGCLWLNKGAHYGPLKNRFLRQHGQLVFGYNHRIDWSLADFTPLTAKKGDMVVLHGLLPHFSRKNFSCRTRFAYTLHSIDKTTYYPKNNWLTWE